MKINPYTSVQLSSTYKTNSANQEELKAKKQGKDKLEISSEALDMHTSNEAEKARTARVEELKRQVENGEYKVDAAKTAERFYDFWKK